MTKQEKLEAVRAACVAANPEIVERFHPYGGENAQIRLADVLLAKVGDRYKSGWDADVVNDVVFNWNLRNDSLDWHAEHQPATIDFLYDLLKTK